MKNNVDIVLFDLGGVLIEAGTFPVKSEWRKDPNSVLPDLAYWVKSEIASEYERGNLSTDEFARMFIKAANLDISPAEFIEAFRQWPIGPFPGVYTLLERLRESYQVALFSNINELHWHRVLNEMKLAGKFDYYFASHLIKRAKPDVNAFMYVAKEMKVNELNRIVFLDDNAANVDSANEAGFRAYQVKGFTEVQEQLSVLGIT